MAKDFINGKMARLEEETSKVFASLENVESTSLSIKGRGWSLIQVLSHLEMSEALSLNYMKKKINAGSGMKRSGVVNKVRMRVTCGFLSSRIKWKAPSYIANPKDDYSLDEIKDKWNDTRSDLRKFVDDYPDEFLNRLVYKHPMAGRQALGEAIDSIIYHQRHHIHQINRIKKELKI